LINCVFLTLLNSKKLPLEKAAIFFDPYVILPRRKAARSSVNEESQSGGLVNSF
jgi:hypothetical protein